MSYNKATLSLQRPAHIKSYLQITKPGIIFGNLVSVMGGALLAAQGHVQLGVLLATLLGVACVIACGCVLNNYIDRDIDSRMERTRNRALVRGEITPRAALVYASVLGVVGLVLLYTQTTRLAAVCAVLGLLIYVGAYSLYFKRHSVHGTFIGSFSGAFPPVIGYCAVSGQFDLAAVILFVMFSLWQMPHSYAIAIFRQGDYARAQLPVLPLVRGITNAKWQIAIYIVLFTVAAALLSLLGYTGYAYLICVSVVGVIWFYLALKGFDVSDHKAWAKKVFAFSIMVVIVLSTGMALDYRAQNTVHASVPSIQGLVFLPQPKV